MLMIRYWNSCCIHDFATRGGASEEYDQALELQTRPVGGRYTAVKLR